MEGSSLLVLSRKSGQRVVIQAQDELITIEIVGVGRNRARVGIEASSKVMVHRQEVWEKVADESLGTCLPIARTSA
ncbi:MAG: carbon storage regulator [Pirellulales bacterium]